MILTCPNCATRFFADDEAIGAGGRRVRCDACGEVWTAVLSSPGKVASSTGLVDLAHPPTEDAGHGQGATEATTTTAPLFVERTAPGRGAKRRDAGRPWALGLIAMLFLVVAGGLIFQPAIQRAFPASAGLYHSLGMKSAGAAGD